MDKLKQLTKTTKDQQIGGQPALKVRDALRRTVEYFYLAELAEKLGVSRQTAQAVIDELVKENYLERYEDESKTKPCWQVTFKGISLVNSSSAKPTSV